MNKTLRDLGYFSYFIGMFIVTLSTLLGSSLRMSPLSLEELFSRITAINAVGVIFLIQGFLCSMASLLTDPQ